MSKRLALLTLAALVLAACTAPAATSSATATPEPGAYVASDPAAFTAAAGRPQLVEFFAFW